MNPWTAVAKNHWEEHRPRMVKALKKAGVYEAALEEAAEKAIRTALDLKDQGVNPTQARSEAMRMFLYLPTEKESPTLDPDRMPYVYHTN